MNFSESPEFRKEYRRLKKKYRSLDNDLSEFKRVVSVIPLGNSKHFHIVTREKGACVVKARLFCRYLRGTSLRTVYVYFEQEEEIEFIEMYYKGNKANEDHNRIRQYLLDL